MNNHLLTKNGNNNIDTKKTDNIKTSKDNYYLKASSDNEKKKSKKVINIKKNSKEKSKKYIKNNNKEQTIKNTNYYKNTKNKNDDTDFECLMSFIINSEEDNVLNKHKTNKNKTDKHKIDKHKTDKSKIDKHKTDKHKTDKYKTDKSKIDKSKIDKHKIDKSKIDKQKTDKQKTDKSKIYKTDKQKADKTKIDKSKIDKSKIVKHKTDKHKTDKHKTDKHKIDKSKNIKKSHKNHPVNKNSLSKMNIDNKKDKSHRKYGTANTVITTNKPLINSSKQIYGAGINFNSSMSKNMMAHGINTTINKNTVSNLVLTSINKNTNSNQELTSIPNNVINDELPALQLIKNVSSFNTVIPTQKIEPSVQNELVVKTNNENKNKKNTNSYLSLITEFCKIYSVTIHEILENPKIEFRYFCYKYLSYIRNVELSEIYLNKEKEAILIEYRRFPHLEFLIRNAINKIGSDWSYSVVCGNLNYDYMVEMCNNISPNIKIIKTNYDNLNQSTYSQLFAKVEFWNLFVGKKLLIYQEDSCVFKSNINDFIDWDYIGAPWAKTQNDNKNCVGNGGFTLRTKQCMIDVINKISLEDTKFNSSTLDYMKNCGMTTGPEDVYFSLNMLTYNIGKVADWETASKFSTESIKNVNSFGGHNFWLSDSKWKDRLYKNIIIQFKPMHYLLDLEHRGGWKLVIENLIESNFYNEKSQIIFFDMLERFFMWDKEYECANEWVGVVHCTQYTPDYLDIVNIQQLFYNTKFIKALEKCLFIISLSNYVGDFLKLQLLRNGFTTKVIILKHPVDKENIILFNYDNYIKNNNKSIIQIGQQLRKMSSIYIINTNPIFKKIWLTGTKNFTKCNTLLEKEAAFLNMNKQLIKDDVEMKYIKTSEFDKLLSENIVFIDLFDASANNTVLECIIRNTPILVNKMAALVEYLGEQYPLYFDKISDAENILSNPSLILEAHEYLKRIDKKEFEMEYFNKKIIQLTRNCIIG